MSNSASRGKKLRHNFSDVLLVTELHQCYSEQLWGLIAHYQEARVWWKRKGIFI